MAGAFVEGAGGIGLGEIGAGGGGADDFIAGEFGSRAVAALGEFFVVLDGGLFAAAAADGEGDGDAAEVEVGVVEEAEAAGAALGIRSL